MSSSKNSKGEQYHLRWNNFLQNMVQIFSDLKHEGQLVDVTLMCEEQPIKAHKIVLAACSDFFMNVFTNISEVHHPIIKFSDISFSHLKKIIEFIYHGEVKVVDEDLHAVLALGEMFRVKGLSAVKMRGQENSSNTHVNKPVKYTILNTHPTLTPIKKPRPLSLDEPTNEPTQKKIKVESSEPKNIEKPIIVIDDNKELLNDKTSSQTQLIKKPTIYTHVQGMIRSFHEDNYKNNENENSMPIKHKQNDSNVNEKSKTERPNPFILFCKDWRKKLIIEHPEEDYKRISVRLGSLWRTLTAETRESYYALARKA
ncbi:uncharacterized protein [Diabrotica undecimpunctata]|uniref:uncharacterized protein n=1 Tax=Diabrotica undecimpunctata TaxID=50387 RepID=UPI003B63AC15